MDAKLNAEIEAALGDMSLEDMMDLADRPQRRSAAPSSSSGGAPGSERQFKTGTVVSIHNDDVFVEFGPKSQGVCPLTQFDEPPQPGARLDFVVERYDQNEGILVLSRQGAVQKATLDALDVGQVVEARCTGTNKGGLEMELAQQKAFMPAGQVDLRHVDDLSVFVGEKFPCEIIELDRHKNRIILSRRSALEAERLRTREKLMETLEVGQQLPAVITSLQPYGAFADLGGVDGLIHISDLSYERIKDPAEVVKVGQTVEVKVLKIDTSHDPPKIGLGLKQLQTDPYQAKSGELEEGATVTGRITQIKDFGAFVEIAPGVEGLIHISELAHERVTRVDKVVQRDQVVNTKILSIDPDRRRISLSLKALADQQAEADVNRGDDPEVRKLKAQLKDKFGDNLKGGIS